MSSSISKEVEQQLRSEAGTRCGYCHTSAVITGQRLTIEHIIPLVLGRTSEKGNLWLSCRRCNEYKGAQTEAVDPGSWQVVKLFNPRIQVWKEHFAWSSDGGMVIGLTPCGRATVELLKMNAADIVSARSLWVSVGWHPPQN
jgi:hypothetical protein